jgi:hypothetical protein
VHHLLIAFLFQHCCQIWFFCCHFDCQLAWLFFDVHLYHFGGILGCFFVINYGTNLCVENFNGFYPSFLLKLEDLVWDLALWVAGLDLV